MENLAYFGNLRDVRGAVLRRRSVELLDFIGLKDKMNVQVRRLSRGQKQKLAVCIALITDPPVLLLDEPTTGLDVQSSRAIKDKIIEMTHQQGKCVLVTTHDMGTAEELCDRIAIIHEGRLAACRPTNELLGVFSDQTVEMHVDRLPDVAALESIPGVLRAETEQANGDVGLVFQMAQDPAARSEALYRTVAALRAQALQLRSISKRQTSLEEVFLRLTSEGAKTGES
jgi:ABC-2 type transport system ATP-binding protein